MRKSDNRSSFRHFLTGILCCLVFFLYAGPAIAEDNPPPTIDDLRLSQGTDAVLLSAQLTAAFDESTLQVIRGGVPLTFRYRVRLTRRGTFLGEVVLRDGKHTGALPGQLLRGPLARR